MARPEMSDSEISIKLAGRQLRFLESRAKELGISEAEVIRWYIVSDMARTADTERDLKRREEEPFSLMGIIRDGRITDKDIEEVMNAQTDLVDRMARFDPKIVKMAKGRGRKD